MKIVPLMIEADNGSPRNCNVNVPSAEPAPTLTVVPVLSSAPSKSIVPPVWVMAPDCESVIRSVPVMAGSSAPISSVPPVTSIVPEFAS